MTVNTHMFKAHSTHCHTHVCFHWRLPCHMHVRPALTSSPTPCIQVVLLLFAPALLLSTPCHLLTPIDATATSTSPTETTANMPSQLVTIVIAVVVSAVLILVVVGLVVVAMVTVVLCRRWNKESTNRGVRSQRTDSTLKSTTYYEPMSLDVDHTHFHHQPHPLHTPHTTSDNGDHIAMQGCPAYQPTEDTPTSVTGDYTYI